jgi:hypothetical protein
MIYQWFIKYYYLLNYYEINNYSDNNDLIIPYLIHSEIYD